MQGDPSLLGESFWNLSHVQGEAVKCAAPEMSLTFDEHGRPFLIVREQEKKQRLSGIDAHKVWHS